MKTIEVSSPTRVDLAGGTLDLWPLYNFVGGATTINVAIDIYTKVRLTTHVGKKIILRSKDVGVDREFQDLSECLAAKDSNLAIFQCQLRYWKQDLEKLSSGFTMESSSESPVGGGLGGSSSLTISLLKAFSQLTDRKFEDNHHLVEVAHNLESEVLNTPTGTQDYYAAASGGMNLLSYSADGIRQQVFPISDSPIRNNFILVYTGRSHHSGMNNFEVLKAAIGKDRKTLANLQQLKVISDEVIEACLGSHWSKLSELFEREYRTRVDLSPAFTCPEIELLHDLSLKAGADAVKICGAGGGGCVLVWAKPGNQAKVVSECQKAGFTVLGAKPVEPIQKV
jgi:D-glycero-alpha-D-manno-heptose-7-phosphate kinase